MKGVLRAAGHMQCEGERAGGLEAGCEKKESRMLWVLAKITNSGNLLGALGKIRGSTLQKVNLGYLYDIEVDRSEEGSRPHPQRGAVSTQRALRAVTLDESSRGMRQTEKRSSGTEPGFAAMLKNDEQQPQLVRASHEDGLLLGCFNSVTRQCLYHLQGNCLSKCSMLLQKKT